MDYGLSALKLRDKDKALEGLLEGSYKSPGVNVYILKRFGSFPVKNENNGWPKTEHYEGYQ